MEYNTLEKAILLLAQSQRVNDVLLPILIGLSLIGMVMGIITIFIGLKTLWEVRKHRASSK